MSQTCVMSLDNRRRYSNASLSNGWSSTDDTTETPAETTHPINMTAYRDDPMTVDHQYEYIFDDGTLTPRYLGPAYPNEQQTPYPNDSNIGDETMDEMAYQFMTGGRQADHYSGSVGSVEALPSTSPPRYAAQEPATELDQYRTTDNSDETHKDGRGWGYGEETTNDVENFRLHGQHTYISGSHFPHHYPDHIAENDLYEPDRTMEVGDWEWEVICIHGYLEQCPFFCPRQT
ncbi:hypothetical protein QBC36DRAFT_97715 [Triangularia setosa]|uniref:Uncharacterized protein n=1 Tax=Triangularia setosa TaxID=2587417 RepID=A0AAN7ACG0_9PEZI|nr:hypothetical protein QBC36DRAFT_97715 [Podospora setosa]